MLTKFCTCLTGVLMLGLGHVALVAAAVWSRVGGEVHSCVVMSSAGLMCAGLACLNWGLSFEDLGLSSLSECV